MYLDFFTILHSVVVNSLDLLSASDFVDDRPVRGHMQVRLSGDI